LASRETSQKQPTDIKCVRSIGIFQNTLEYKKIVFFINFWVSQDHAVARFLVHNREHDIETSTPQYKSVGKVRFEAFCGTPPRVPKRRMPTYKVR
jgi:hypothetical protein